MFLAQKNFAMLHQILHAITVARPTMMVIHFPVLMVVIIVLAIMEK
jgi:hypothetical protein